MVTGPREGNGEMLVKGHNGSCKQNECSGDLMYNSVDIVTSTPSYTGNLLR